MSDKEREGLYWWGFMAFLLGLLLISQYLETPQWKEAIKPGLVVVAFGFLLKTFADLYNWIFDQQRRPKVCSLIGPAFAFGCLLALWILDRNTKALYALIGLTFGAFVIVIMVRWIFGKIVKGRKFL